MSIKATSQISIADLNDAQALSGYLTSNLPKVQIFNPNSDIYDPNWGSTPNLKVTPILFINQTVLANNAPGLTITWWRKEGAGNEEKIENIPGESIANGILTVSQNKLSAVVSGLLTYICKVSYIDTDTGMTTNIELDITYSLIKTAMDAKLIGITGEQAFKYDKNSIVSPSQINVNAHPRNVGMGKWQYKNASGTWVDYPISADNSSIETTSLIIKPGHTVFFNDKLELRATTQQSGIYDIMTIYKVRDGATGALGAEGKDAYTVIASNEAFQYHTDSTGKVTTHQIVMLRIITYKGATKVTPAINTLPSMPAGMTIEKGAVKNQEQYLAVGATKNAILGESGLIDIPVIVDGKTFTKQLSWTRSTQGQTGTKGADAVVFTVYAPQGQVFINQKGTLELNSSAYDGPTEITTGATYQWKRYSSGTWINVVGGTSKSITINGSDVQAIGSYKCEMTYKGSTYTDVITLEDKSDSMLATILSTGGDVFKNTVGHSELITKVFQNGVEVDELKSTHIGVTAPTNPVTNTLWYKVNRTAKTVELQKYSSGAWSKATGADLHEYTYKWYRRDSDGAVLDNGDIFKEGKVIFIDGEDVDIKTTFIVEIY